MVRFLDDLLETKVLASPVSDSLDKVVNQRLRRQEILKIIIVLCRYIIPFYGLLYFWCLSVLLVGLGKKSLG